MADWLRQFLMPAAVLAIVATVWSLAWAKEIQFKAVRAARAAGCQIVVHDQGDTPSVELLNNIPKASSDSAVAVRDDGDR